jgi:hypothetical protein
MLLISLFALIHINCIITLDFIIYVGYKLRYNIQFKSYIFHFSVYCIMSKCQFLLFHLILFYYFLNIPI